MTKLLRDKKETVKFSVEARTKALWLGTPSKISVKKGSDNGLKLFYETLGTSCDFNKKFLLYLYPHDAEKMILELCRIYFKK